MMISRRNFLAVAGAAAAAAALTACGGSSSSTASSAAASTSTAASTAEGGEKIMKVALTCDTGTIDDESFNQACWTAVSGYMGDDCQYYIPEADASDEDRETMIRQAVNDGADVIVCVGYLYGASLAWAADQYPDVKFIAVDVTQGDIGTDSIPANCYCITFKEEQAGYLAGYAIVKDGKTKLGFLGGMAVPAVIRYGYGFVQGADAAAAELGQNIEINYFYAAQEAQLGLAVLCDGVACQIACLLLLEGNAVAVSRDSVGADIALSHIDGDELDIGILVSSPCQRSAVQVADTDDHISAVVDSLTDHGLAVLIGSVSLGNVVLAVIAHVAGNSSPACLVEALIIDRAGIACQSDLDDLLTALSSRGSSRSSSGRSGAGRRSGRTAASGQSSGSGSGTSHSQEITTRNHHNQTLLLFLIKLRQTNKMRRTAHLLAQV